MSWKARFNYLTAKSEQKNMALYQMDLIWLIAKKGYNVFDCEQPSIAFSKRRKKKDTRTAKQIAQDVLNKMMEGGSQNGAVQSAGKSNA